MPARTIDLNCDLGEGDDAPSRASDLALLEVVSSANIACGGHAGDERSMEATVRAAMQCGVAVGAHPSFPDRPGFGRVELAMSPAQIEYSTAAQIGALENIVRSCDGRIRHVKPHGALYHAAMHRPEVARAIARAARGLLLVGLAGAPGLDTWRAMGCQVVAEAFADRRYEPDGSLRSRGLPDALITDPNAAAAQALDIALGRGVLAGRARISLHADTICIHSDTPGAIAVARAVREALEQAGLAIHQPPHRADDAR